MFRIDAPDCDAFDFRSYPFCDQLFLITESGSVIGRRAVAAHPAVGENFFTFYPMSEAERAEYYRSLCEPDFSCFFFCAGGLPTLFLRSFHAQSRMLAVLVPDRETYERLGAPAAFADYLDKTRFSREVLAIPPHTPCEENVAFACEQLRTVCKALYPRAVPVDSTAGLITALSARAEGVAALCGCKLTYDFLGFGTDPVKNANLDLFTTVLFPACLLARRAAKDHGLALFADRERADDAVIHLTLDLLGKDDPLTELLPLTGYFSTRGTELIAVRHPEIPEQLHLRFSLCRREISVQGVKSPFRYRGGVPDESRRIEEANDEEPTPVCDGTCRIFSEEESEKTADCAENA